MLLPSFNSFHCRLLLFFFCFICHFYPPFTRKRIVSLYFGVWTVSPHSLGSCLFQGLWATCLPHKGGGVPLSALPKDTTSELAGLFSTTSPKCRAPSREAIDDDSTRGMNPRSTNCEADALTATPSRRLLGFPGDTIKETHMLFFVFQPVKKWFSANLMTTIP